MSLPQTYWMDLAAHRARHFLGATLPNPAVGACIVSAEGQVLALTAHERCGETHAEAKAISAVQNNPDLRPLLKSATLFVTLEPCNHVGRTPPCTATILQSGIRSVFYGCSDHNPNVAGNGAGFLKANGIHCQLLETDYSNELNQYFKCVALQKRPFLRAKIAYKIEETGFLSHLPAPKLKTFTSQDSLRMAHILRRESSVIVTSLKTILADWPMFTVRLVPDHSTGPGQTRPPKRTLVVVGSQLRFQTHAETYARYQHERSNDFNIVAFDSARPLKGLIDAINRDVQHQLVLLESGPTLLGAFESERLVDERHTFITTKRYFGGEDSPDGYKDCYMVHKLLTNYR